MSADDLTPEQMWALGVTPNRRATRLVKGEPLEVPGFPDGKPRPCCIIEGCTAHWKSRCLCGFHYALYHRSPLFRRGGGEADLSPQCVPFRPAVPDTQETPNAID